MQPSSCLSFLLSSSLILCSWLHPRGMQLVVERAKTATLGGDWFLDFIEVTDVSRSHTYKWKCGAWFDDKAGLRKEWSVQGQTAGTPQPLMLIEAPGGVDAAGGRASAAGDLFRLRFKTGDRLAAGTDATVRVEFSDVSGAKWQPLFPQVRWWVVVAPCAVPCFV